MGYEDLLRALDEEAAREASRIREDAAREAERILEMARRAMAEERATALAAAAAEEEAALARTKAAARRASDEAVLGAARGHLGRVRQAALARAKARARDLLARVADELAALAPEGPVTFVADPPDLDALRAHLARHHPDLLARAAIRAAPEPRGGLALEAAGETLDDTVEARLERAWPAIESRVAAALLGGDGGPV